MLEDGHGPVIERELSVHWLIAICHDEDYPLALRYWPLPGFARAPAVEFPLQAISANVSLIV